MVEIWKRRKWEDGSLLNSLDFPDFLEDWAWNMRWRVLSIVKLINVLVTRQSCLEKAIALILEEGGPS